MARKSKICLLIVPQKDPPEEFNWNWLWPSVHPPDPKQLLRLHKILRLSYLLDTVEWAPRNRSRQTLAE